jgi:hypothetical protein
MHCAYILFQRKFLLNKSLFQNSGVSIITLAL